MSGPEAWLHLLVEGRPSSSANTLSPGCHDGVSTASIVLRRSSSRQGLDKPLELRAADPWQPHIKAQTPRDQRGLGHSHFPCLHGFFTCRCTLKKNVAGGEGGLLLYVGLDGLIPGDREDELVGHLSRG